MSDALKKRSKESQIPAKSRTDSRAIIIEPIDYSFKDLMVLEEIYQATPRTNEKNGEPKRKDDKFLSTGLKLGYNALKDVNGLYEWCEQAFLNPENISSLDISFNCISDIPDEVLKFTGLRCLYLHGNKILDLSQVEKLKKLKNLTALTLHGNPVETLIGFRHYILSKLPNLKHLNFSGISKADRETAIIWTKSNNKPLKAELDDGSTKTKKKNVDSDED